MGKSFDNRVVMITGASSGIGAALARELAREGAKLLLFARRQDRLFQLKEEIESNRPDSIEIFRGDVSSSEDLTAAAEAAKNKWGRLDIVVANAGFGVSGLLADLTLEDYERQFETNVFGVLRTIYSTLSEVKKNRGQYVFLGSVMSYVTLPGSSPYAMSKHAVRALSDTLYHEFREDGIGVTLVCPGFVESEIRNLDNYGTLYPDIPDPIPAWLRWSGRDAALTILKAIKKRKREIVFTQHGKLGVWLQRYFPSILHVAVRLFGLKGGKQKAIPK